MQTKKRTFKHLTKNDRLRIERWLRRGLKPQEIADKMRVHISTIYRELKRGQYERLDGDTWEMVTAYSPDIAEERYQANLREKGPDLKIGNDHELAAYIEETIITKECSPAAVLGYALMEGRKFKTSVSVATIYSYIKKGLFLRITQVDLPRHGKKKQGYKKVKTKKDQARASAGESIERRPEEVENREEFGHWEMDTVYSRKNSTTKALLVLTERKTRREIIILVPNRKAETIVRAIDALERKIGAAKFRKIFKSITVDNGSEFSAAEELERSAINKTIPRTKVYFCHPYSSWERGSNENANIMIRRKHPKGTNFAKVSAAEIADTERWINNYPRKILGYMSSEVMFRACLRELGVIA
ncbi:MAG: IS30 family transposase [Eubacteriales bacterium]|nr:IS30 family transposase [Eubacteriales bacterium]